VRDRVASVPDVGRGDVTFQVFLAPPVLDEIEEAGIVVDAV